MCVLASPVVTIRGYRCRRWTLAIPTEDRQFMNRRRRFIWSRRGCARAWKTIPAAARDMPHWLRFAFEKTRPWEIPLEARAKKWVGVLELSSEPHHVVSCSPSICWPEWNIKFHIPCARGGHFWDFDGDGGMMWVTPNNRESEIFERFCAIFKRFCWAAMCYVRSVDVLA